MTWLKSESGRRRMLPLLLVIALVLPALLPLANRQAGAAEESWKPVTLLYTSDIKGKIDPCG